VVIDEISLEVRLAARPLLISFLTVIVKFSIDAGDSGSVSAVNGSCRLQQRKTVVANVEFVTCSG
jgi:hypothetical protein